MLKIKIFGENMKHSIEYVRRCFIERGFTLCDKTYINSKTKMKCIDSDGYVYSLSFDDISDKRRKAFYFVSKNNPYSIQNIQTYINAHGYKTIVLSKEYINEKSILLCRCECGESFETTWNHIQCANKFTCTNCGINRRVKKQTYSREYAENICLQNGFELIDYDGAKKCTIKDRDGYLYQTTLFNIVNSKHCFDKFDKFNKFTIQNMNTYIENNNIGIKMVDRNNRTIEVRTDKIEWICRECGNIFTATWSQVKNDGKCLCEKCSKTQSSLSKIIECFLEENNIRYVKEKRFDDCRNLRTLPFDFYLIDYNTVIEVHGQQHYYKSDMFSEPLEHRQRIDRIKEEYCKNNNIGYVAIPFWKIKNNSIKDSYKEIIFNILG